MSQNPLHLTQAEIRDLDKNYRRNLINGLPGFKSLCLCGTCDAEGRTNLALMSQVIHVGANPPLMGILFRPAVVPRHTLTNLEATRVFTLNHVHAEIYRQAHQCSARYPAGQSEFEATGLTPHYTEGMQAPYVAESFVKIGLQFRERHQVLANQTIFIVGEIMEIILPAEIVGEDGFPDLETAGSLTVSGLDSYHRTERLRRLPYAKVGEKRDT